MNSALSREGQAMAQPPMVRDTMSIANVAQSLIPFCVVTGTWPYTYATCDVGTLPNQTNNGQPAAVAAADLSFLPGQRLSACTCSGADHPGPSVNVGRGAPEIDVLEAQIDATRFVGQVSQSLQVAPFNIEYLFNNATPATTVQGSATNFNSYHGGQYQQAVSAVSDISSANYNGSGFTTYGYEWWSDPNHRSDGYIQWYSEGQQTWKITPTSLEGDQSSQINSRIIPEEPMVRCCFRRGCITMLITVSSTSSST